MHPGCVNRRPWHDPYYDPIWAACERHDIPVCFHGGGQTYLKPDYALEVFDKLMMWHVFNQPLGIQATVVSLASGGVLQKFPGLEGRPARGQLRLGAVAHAAARRALGVGRRDGRARPREAAVGVLPLELLPELSKPTRTR